MRKELMYKQDPKAHSHQDMISVENWNVHRGKKKTNRSEQELPQT